LLFQESAMSPTTQVETQSSSSAVGVFSPYLEETRFCDTGHPEIEKIDKSEYSVRAFYRVRDNTRYYVGQISETASETLARRRGSCTNKANLLVALLRAMLEASALQAHAPEAAAAT
jgi:transglutaminase-like putative cysteine protease